MKRKIAILLAATMTLGAVPTLAVSTKAPTAANTTTVQTGKLIYTENKELATYAPNLDTVYTNESGNKAKVKAYKRHLATREGMLEIGLNAGKEFDDSIKKGSTFQIKLAGGTFKHVGETDPAAVAYRNANVNMGTDGAAETVTQFFVENGVLKTAGSTGGTGNELKGITNLEQFAKKLEGTDVNTVGNNNNTTEITSTELAKVEAGLPTIPYSIKIDTENTATVTVLTDITYDNMMGDVKVPEAYAVKDSNKVDRQREKQLYFAIPLGAIVESNGEEEVKATVSGFSGNLITEGTVTLAKSVGNGSTAIDKSSVDKKVFEYDVQPSDIIIKENIKGTFKDNEQVTIRLNSGFEFSGQDKNVKVVNASTNEDVLVSGSAKIEDKNKITFKLNKLSSNEKQAIKITLPKIVPADEAKNYGEVSVNIYGAGITDETVVIGERQQLGFKLETKTEVPTIVKGRYDKLNSTLKQNGNESAEFEFSELVADSLLTERNLDFSVPEGVKIVDAEVITMSGVGYRGINDFNSAFEIKNDGKTLRIERKTLDNPAGGNTAKIRLKLWLSVDAGYQGEDIKLSVTGGGSNETYEAVIAKVQSPFKVEAKSKDINIGYQDYAVNDIIIEETAPGMFMEGEEIRLQITAPYGTSEMGFTKAKVTSEGEIEIAPINGKTGDQYGYLEDNKTKDANNTIRIKVKTRSTKNPAKITISDVKIGTTRSVPFGAYNLTIEGGALLNNDIINDNDKFINEYTDTKKVADVIKNLSYKLDNSAASDDVKKAKRIDTTTSSFVIPGYVNVITANNTIDSEVKVAIGSTNATINGKEVAMDVAPYIQGTGNTMVPLRFVAVALAGGDATSVEAAQNSEKVSWDARTKTVTIFYGAGIGQKIIQFKIGSTNMIVDGNVIPMENGAKAEIKNGRTFVPFRALGQALGVSVSWDEASKTAIYNKQ